jgi:hypothetical protein
MTMPYPSSPNDPGQPHLPAVHEPIPQRIHEPIPAEPINPGAPVEPDLPPDAPGREMAPRSAHTAPSPRE